MFLHDHATLDNIVCPLACSCRIIALIEKFLTSMILYNAVVPKSVHCYWMATSLNKIFSANNI
jgi:hypothetical protein